MKQFFRSLVTFYQGTFSYFLGGHCRYYPSCSHYATEAFETQALFKALHLIFRRVLSCHPLSKKSFYDPVPGTDINLFQRGLCEHSE